MNTNIIIGFTIFLTLIFYYFSQNKEKLDKIPLTYSELNELFISTVLLIAVLIVFRLKILNNNVSNNKIVSYISIIAPVYFVFYLTSKLLINFINSDTPIVNNDEIVILKTI